MSDAGRPTPRRRWYQWRLSTWFALVALLGGLLAARPYVLEDRLGAYAGRESGPPWGPIYHVERGGLNPKLIWPAVGMLAFASWKAGAAIRRR